MELFIAGGCSEHGRNCFLVRGQNVSFLVDAGIMKEKPEMPFPELTGEQIRHADYLFLTHCHTDHTGAVKWLIDRGFHGEIIASEPTLSWMKEKVNGRTLESMSLPGKKCRVDNDLKMTWGRSGHCIGAVWYLFRLENRRILFTGDYQEHSGAFKCDRIRDMRADIAVADCAYGDDPGTASDYRKQMRSRMDSLLKKNKPYLFPVPSHGRGLDVLRVLADRGIPVYMPDEIISECMETPDKEFWLRKKFRGSFEDMDFHSLEELQELSGNNWHERFSGLNSAIGILVLDSQLYKKGSQELADAVVDAGGKVILTGKQVPSSYARTMLEDGRAEFLKISVHQNKEELLHLKDKNKFHFLLPYHCRKTLSFSDPTILVLKAGDIVKF